MKKKKIRWWVFGKNKIKLQMKELEFKEQLQKEKEKHELQLNALNTRIEKLNELLFKKLCEITKLEETIQEKDEKIKEQATEKANLSKQITNLEKQLAESMTDKYLVRKIPSGRTPKGAKAPSVRRQASSVQKHLKEVEKINEQ